MVKDCGYEDSEHCIPTNVKMIDGSGGIGLLGSSYCVIIASGSTICIKPMYSSPGGINIDVNGSKPPNILGRDIFNMSFFIMTVQ